MTRTISLKTLFIPILAISLIGAFGISNAYAQQSTSCTGDCTAPTIGLSWNHKQLVTGGVTINGQAIDITGFSQTITPRSVSTGNTVSVVLKIYEDTSVGSYLQHASLTVADCSMEWQREFDGTETTYVISNIQSELRKPVTPENCNILQNVNTRSNVLDELLTEVSFSFEFTQPTESESMKISIWDSRKNVNNFHLDEAFTVTGMPLSMSKTMPTMRDNTMMDEGSCNRGTVFVMNSFTGLTSCILKHHVSIWNNYGWTT
jgi:hypothetical protein